jgi:hypothetical protein
MPLVPVPIKKPSRFLFLRDPSSKITTAAVFVDAFDHLGDKHEGAYDDDQEDEIPVSKLTAHDVAPMNSESEARSLPSSDSIRPLRRSVPM